MNKLYSSALRKMIDYSIKRQHDFNYRQNMDKMDYIDEFCTIRLKGPRRSGHSKAVSDLARVYDAWIVSPNTALGDYNHKEWKKKCSVRSLDQTRGNVATVVLCDSVDTLKKADIELLHAMSYGQETFVLVYVG